MIERASEADTNRLYTMLEQHIQESRVTQTVDELLLSVNVVLPTRDEQGTIQGFIAYDAVDTVMYGRVAIWKIIYTDPAVRKDFKNIMVDVLKFFKSQGYDHVESHCNYKVHNIYSRRLASKAECYIHFGKIDDYLRRLDN